jgi:NADPH-dependent 2,4-dienoyl-CoA reductase/sulfur reductase-like enzyme
MSVAPAGYSKKVLVVGGGIAGLVAARTAALRGHDVTLCEMGSELGGILRTEQALPFKLDMYNLGVTYALLCERAGVDIRLNTKVDAAFADEFGADAVIVAVGSEARTLPMPFDEAARVLSIDDLYLGGEEPGDEVVIIGGGLTGCECALQLAREGKKAHLFEIRDGLAIDANIRNRPILLAEIEDANVDVHVSTVTEQIDANRIVFSDADGQHELPFDSIVCAVGQRSRVADVEELRDAAPFVRIVGDAVRPANITTAVYEAFHAALDI